MGYFDKQLIELPQSWTSPGTAELIKVVIRTNRELYPQAIYEELKDRIQKMGYKPTSYQSIRNLIYVLKRLGLIRETRRERVPGRPTAFPRVYYELVPGRETRVEWRNPIDALYHPERFREMTRFREETTPEEWTEQMRDLK